MTWKRIIAGLTPFGVILALVRYINWGADVLERDALIFFAGAAALGILLLAFEYVPRMCHLVWHRVIAKIAEELRRKMYMMDVREQIHDGDTKDRID